MCRVKVRNNFVAFLKGNFSFIGSSYVKLFGKAEVDVNLSLGQFVKVNEFNLHSLEDSLHNGWINIECVSKGRFYGK